METKWWENFFQGIALDFWRAAVNEAQTRSEADFIVKQLQVSPGAKLLDVPCGNGRLSLELAARGFQLTGVDIASEFIDEAKSSSSKNELEVEWHNHDMRALPWSEEFDGAFCFGNSFGYLDDEENADFLTAVSRTLKAGGGFILDAPAIAECLLPVFEERRWYEFGGITLLINNRYDHEQSRLFTEYRFIRDGQSEQRPSSQRIYSYNELVRLLRQAGFQIESAYSSIKEEPFKLGSRGLLLVCRRGD